MARILGGEEWPRLEASLRGEPATGLRVNTLKLSPEAFAGLTPWALSPIPWCPSGFAVEGGGRPGRHPFHAAGLYYLQEPAAMAVAEALAPRPGELVLDLAAAPGGKSTHLAGLLAERGLLIANDAHGGRARELSRNLERWGSRRVVVTSAEVADLAGRWGGSFDAVLLDAPCSGEGMFRKTPEALEQWSAATVASCALRQRSLLAEAARLVAPDGRLVYSTCTFAPEENEGTVADFLDERPGWEVVETRLPGADPARADWTSAKRAAELSGALRLWPHRGPGEGHFVAVLRRSPHRAPIDRGLAGSSQHRQRTRKAARRRQATSGSAELRRAGELWRGFVSGELARDPVPGHTLTLRPDGLYAEPEGGPDTAGVRVMRPGLWLGGIDRGRFEPAHALALALRREEAARSIDLVPGEGELEAYLAGAELERPGSDGWALITVAGHPLGWGRRAKGIVKNRYPKGLRRRPVDP